MVCKNGAFLLGFNANSNTLCTFDFLNSVARVSSTVLTNNVTYHLVLTFQSAVASGTKIWVNGGLVFTTTVTVNSQANNASLASNTNASQNFPGTLDECAIYNYVLSPAQIGSHFVAGGTPPPSDSPLAPGLVF